ncbi:MAG: D-alanyl-D-alanine carboxypeptidase family protein [Mariprofundaceae bacterium]|nr:D-alanyl-D-alanine carboxypeptidase family protein [Mariprofundaceae bacterium]
MPNPAAFGIPHVMPLYLAQASSHKESTPMRFYLFILLTLLFTPQWASATSWPSQPDIQASAWILINVDSGQTLSKYNEKQELPPASLTKMMTLYLVFEALKNKIINPEEKVDVSEKAWKIGGSRMFIEPRLHPTVDQLMHGISTVSGNDACIALAEHMSGSEEAFAHRMNKKAKELGLKHSHFKNATGFPIKGHYSSAQDMAILAVALWNDFPEKFKLFSEKEFSYNKVKQNNRNRLLWRDPRVNGIKTGHTEEAGFCLVSSAQKDGTRIVSAVFGAESSHAREQQSRLLLNYGFRHFINMKPTQRDLRREVEVQHGSESKVWLSPRSQIMITVPKDMQSQVVFRLRYSAPLVAPIAKNQVIGVIEAIILHEDEEVLASVDMLAAKEVKLASWPSRQLENIQIWWKK